MPCPYDFSAVRNGAERMPMSLRIVRCSEEKRGEGNRVGLYAGFWFNILCIQDRLHLSIVSTQEQAVSWLDLKKRHRHYLQLFTLRE